MSNFLIAAVPDLDSVQAYLDSIPDFVKVTYAILGFLFGFLFFSVNGVIEVITAYFRQRSLKNRLDKSSQELCDYVDKYIERKESEGEKDVTSTDLL